MIRLFHLLKMLVSSREGWYMIKIFIGVGITTLFASIFYGFQIKIEKIIDRFNNKVVKR